MTKAELIDAVSQASGVSRSEAERAIGALFEVVVSTARTGEKIGWPGFGSFSTSTSKARTGRNPQTGAPVKIAESTRLKFSASSTLKSSLNNKQAGAKKAGASKAASKAGAAASKAGASKAGASKAAASKSSAASSKAAASKAGAAKTGGAAKASPAKAGAAKASTSKASRTKSNSTK